MTVEHAPFVVLGAGLAGLAAAWELGDQAIVVERDPRAGGLVRTERRGDYWFDRVLHLLYFADPVTEQRVRALLGDELAPCAPEAWVETRSGVSRFPIQMHLGTLDKPTVVACLRELAAATYGPAPEPPRSFEALLLASFGPTLCDEFFFPYNRKVWKRPLASLAPSGFQWNITMPDFTEVIRGALSNREYRAYNARGFYPRPAPGAPVRGMEVLSRRLANQVFDLRLEHRVEAIDLDERCVVVDTGGARRALRYDRAVISTLPLPAVIAACPQAPEALRQRCRSLAANRVTTVALSISGPRPVGRGHWRYYADESVCFTRLVYLHEFDPDSGPVAGWGLLAELTEPSEAPRQPDDAVIRRVLADLDAVGGVPSGGAIVDACVLVSDPAYVVFDLEASHTIAESQAFLARHDVFALGRYGRWEYSSMAQVMRDGFALAAALRGSRRTA